MNNHRKFTERTNEIYTDIKYNKSYIGGVHHKLYIEKRNHCTWQQSHHCEAQSYYPWQHFRISMLKNNNIAHGIVF